MSYTWLVYWFISLCLQFMSWHDFTWLDNPVWQCTYDKTAISQHSGSRFLIISSVLCKDWNDNYSQLVHWGEFGNKWLDAWRQHRSDNNQVMTPFQQRFGKPCLCWTTLSVWEKVCLCREIRRILLGAVGFYPKRWPVLW